jgi:flagella basal body P-ring formation protein FlgA
LRIREAAAVQNDMVLLGDIAEPYGPINEDDWRDLAERPLWPAPPEPGKPLQITKVRLAQALRERLGDLADRCLLPSGLAIQRGGAVWYEQDLRAYLVKTLTPGLNALPGRAELTDFRLPAYIFLAHAGQGIETEPVKPAAGRLNLRFQVVEVDGSVARRFTGTAFVNLWADAPCAAVPMNRGDVVKPETITMMGKNLAYVKGNLWDGRGGPWQVTRSLSAGQPILVTDIEPQSAIRRGAIVTLVYDKGNVKVSTQAEALADGGMGDTIAVRNLQSKKQVFGTVRDSATVVAK